MKWTQEAEDAIKKVPFFVRKKVRARVEKEARLTGRDPVTLAVVQTARKKFLANMSSDIKGYQVDACFGAGGCPNRTVESEGLLAKLEHLLQQEDLLGFLKQHVPGDLKYHHEFRVTISDCPNACSQPQIKDIGILGVSEPAISAEVCSLCGTCVEVCRDQAVQLVAALEKPLINRQLCLQCGLCAKECPTGTIVNGKKGFRILLGGKLGRHPRLAEPIPGIHSEEEILAIVKKCIDYYKANSRNGTRFAELYAGPQFLEEA
ncbi:MAG: sulfite reductase [Desulfobacterales bacterium]|nr:sulfite reductase [Desulfobacterales bacterium]